MNIRPPLSPWRIRSVTSLSAAAAAAAAAVVVVVPEVVAVSVVVGQQQQQQHWCDHLDKRNTSGSVGNNGNPAAASCVAALAVFMNSSAWDICEICVCSSSSSSSITSNSRMPVRR
jgi:hypothetical protein